MYKPEKNTINRKWKCIPHFVLLCGTKSVCTLRHITKTLHDLVNLHFWPLPLVIAYIYENIKASPDLGIVYLPLTPWPKAKELAIPLELAIPAIIFRECLFIFYDQQTCTIILKYIELFTSYTRQSSALIGVIKVL